MPFISLPSNRLPTSHTIAKIDNCQRLKIENLLSKQSRLEQINFGDLWQGWQFWQSCILLRSYPFQSVPPPYAPRVRRHPRGKVPSPALTFPSAACGRSVAQPRFPLSVPASALTAEP